MAELKPCPFCGGTKLGFSSKTVSRDCNTSHLFHGAIYCKNCNAYGARVLSEKVKNSYPMQRVDFDGLESRAIEAWNRRYTPEEIDFDYGAEDE